MNSELPQLGRQLHSLVAELYPICRSITGPGVRETLKRLRRFVPLEIREVATGASALDWTVPREWIIRDAYIKDSSGRRVVDFHASNLHVMSYSVPVHRRMRLNELRSHLHSLPDRPKWIPYRTSYYAENWGFCVAHELLKSLPDVEYEVCIDSELRCGHLTYGELLIPGASSEEVLLSCHICHPSLANDNLSGVAVATRLAQHLTAAPRRYSYRFLFAPGTIGALVWLAANRQSIDRIKHGLVLTLLGDGGSIHYKRSRRQNAEIDRVVEQVLQQSGCDHAILNFDPGGYDERQYCSPGFNLPVGCFMRTPHGQFPEYHTSADNLDFVRPQSLADSYQKLVQVVAALESREYATAAPPSTIAREVRSASDSSALSGRRFVNLYPYGEPQLGRRGLYRTVGGQTDAPDLQLAMLWVLNLSDGRHSLGEIAGRSKMPISTLAAAAERLLAHGLIEEPG